MVRTAEVRHTAGVGWFFKIRAANGEVVAVSEVYSRRWSAVRAAKTTEVGLVRVYARSGRLVKTVNG